MNVFNTLKKLFVHGCPSQEIIPINQIISLPTREIFSQNKRMLELIDTYKDEYKNILSQFKYLTSLDMNSKDLSENMSVNIELLLNIFMNADEVKQITLKDKIDYLINVRKLDLYSIAISKLESEVTARLIALNEIYNERKMFLPRNKKNALANEINNLSVDLVLFVNKKLAIELEKNRYLTQAIYMTEENQNQIEERLISKKRVMLLKIEQVLFPESKIEIREDREHILGDMAEVERMIEIYVYNHKNDVNSLKECLERIWESDIYFAKKEELLSFISDLEMKYLAFYEYGRKDIDLEDLMQLYLIKFNILVLSDNGICELFVDDNTIDIELDCYKGIIEREIESFVKGMTEFNNPEAIKIIINILKKGQQTFNAEEILTDKYLLNILLSMRNKKDLINLLKNFKVKKKNYGYFSFCDEIFEWEEELPLETIYRIMLSQKVGYDADLYELLENDIYPDKELYFLPVGLKAINYNVDHLVEEYWLDTTTLLTIQKMRELMNDKYVICPSSLIRIKNGNDFFQKTSPRSLLFFEGLEIAPYDTRDIEIIERDSTKITYHDRAANEIITSNLNCYINKKWGYDNATGLLTFVPDKNLYIEEYNSYEYGVTRLEKGKNVIEARRDAKTELLSRTYVDVSTKYGDFCLHIEEKKANYHYGPHLWLSLYHGHHNEVIDDLTNDFNWPEYGIFRTKYLKSGHFSQWMLGFVDNVWNHPLRNIWTYGETIYQGKKSTSPIYSFSEYQGNGKRGTIFIDGRLKLKENQECVPDMFENLQVEEYEYSAYNSKAYFGNSQEHVAIFKEWNSNKIKIIYKKRNKRTGKFEEISSIDIPSLTNNEFTVEDFLEIINVISVLTIDNGMKKFVLDELMTYVNLHYGKMGFGIGDYPNEEWYSLSNMLKREGYDLLLDTLDRSNATEFVEKLIENIIDTFRIDLIDLLGENSPSKAKVEESKKVQTLRKN